MLHRSTEFALLNVMVPKECLLEVLSFACMLLLLLPSVPVH
jgi:hypothetical protein